MEVMLSASTWTWNFNPKGEVTRLSYWWGGGWSRL